MSNTLRRAIRPLMPEGLLRLWRRLYWWDAQRIRPGRARRLARELIASGRPIRLELGSGPRMEGWTSLDLNVGAHLQHDLTKPLPFPDISVDEIYSSHVLEHFTYPQPMLHVLRECHRVLKPAGWLRIAVPDARIFLNAYFDPASFDVNQYTGEDVGLSFRNRIDIVNFVAYLGGDHKFMFDDENLPNILEEAGFRDASIRPFDADIDIERRRHESIYAGAVK